MPSEERIQTLHPDPAKNGVRISRRKYDQVSKAIQTILARNTEMTFGELMEAVQRELRGSFQGSISWYYTTVKLDLEARGVIVRLPGNGPQRLRLASHEN